MNENTHQPREPFHYLLVLDFEATCSDEKRPNPQEIIEFPTLLYNVKTRTIDSVFHHYIKPDVHPTLSSFCTELTGITQDQVDSGISLQDALSEHVTWLESNELDPYSSTCSDIKEETSKSASFIYVTCGDWDFKTCLRKQLDYHGISMPPNFKRWLNIKREFQHLYGRRAKGMTSMLNHLNIDLEGRHHSGIDDTRNIASICTRMLEDGWIPSQF